MTANDDTAAGGAKWKPTRPYGYGGGEEAGRRIAALEAELDTVKRERDGYKQDADTLDKLYHERWDQLAAVKRKLAEVTTERDAAWRERDAFVESHDRMRDSLDAATEALAEATAALEATTEALDYVLKEWVAPDQLQEALEALSRIKARKAEGA